MGVAGGGTEVVVENMEGIVGNGEKESRVSEIVSEYNLFQ